jgi:hypothetical protein
MPISISARPLRRANHWRECRVALSRPLLRAVPRVAAPSKQLVWGQPVGKSPVSYMCPTVRFRLDNRRLAPRAAGAACS